ncbi:hypothetical protein AB3R30_20115 [Leptolyngbyaceae cyanobacterium UHCC 1019]
MSNRKFYLSVLCISLLLNFLVLLNSCNSPEYKFGVLERDVPVVLYTISGKKVLLTLPKGLTVRNETPEGLARISLLAPYRFSVQIADGEDDLVDYSRSGRSTYSTKRTETGKF